MILISEPDQSLGTIPDLGTIWESDPSLQRLQRYVQPVLAPFPGFLTRLFECSKHLSLPSWAILAILTRISSGISIARLTV